MHINQELLFYAIGIVIQKSYLRPFYRLLLTKHKYNNTIKFIDLQVIAMLRQKRKGVYIEKSIKMIEVSKEVISKTYSLMYKE